MTKLNRKLEYALMALKLMAHKRQGELTTAKEVVEAVGCPFDATARVMQMMCQHGILKSEHGAHGGYLLVRDLAKVSIFDLMEIILGPRAAAKCLQGACDLEASCNIMSPVTVLNRKQQEFFRGISVGELLRKPKAVSEVSL